MNGFAWGNPTNPSPSNPAYRVFQKESDMITPTREWVLIDEDETTIDDGMFVVHRDPQYGWEDMLCG